LSELGRRIELADSAVIGDPAAFGEYDAWLGTSFKLPILYNHFILPKLRRMAQYGSSWRLPERLGCELAWPEPGGVRLQGGV
jgi:hypothetical protein